MSSKIFCGDQKQSGKNIEQFPRYFTKGCFFRPLKKTLGDFLVENFPIFPIQNIPEYVFKTLLWGPEPIRKKYWAVFEIFTKIMIFSTFFSKKNKNIRRFLSAKFSDFSNSEYSRICLKNSSVGTKNNQEKILSSFRDISKKVVFFDLKMGDPCPIHHPSTIHHIKNRGRPKRTITSSKFKVQKHLF